MGGQPRSGGANSDRRDDRTDIRLEDVGPHPGNISDIVTDVVRNGRWVPWIVLRNACFDLAHQVGADVGRLGEDTASDPSKECDRARPHREAGDDLAEPNELAIYYRVSAVYREQHADAEQAKRSHCKPHHCTAKEGDTKGLALAEIVRGSSSPSVGPSCGLHSEESCRHGTQGTKDVSDRRGGADRVREQQCDDDDKAENYGVLGLQERHRAIVNLLSDVDHGLVTGILLLHVAIDARGRS